MNPLLVLPIIPFVAITIIIFIWRKSLDKNNWVSIGTAVLAGLLVMAGWIFVNNQNADNRIHATRLNYLLDAVSDLAFASNRCPEEKYTDMIETAVAKIQLLGNNVERDALASFIDEWKRNNGRQADLNSLVNILRASLRSELGLSPISGNVTWLRIRGGAIDEESCGNSKNSQAR